MKGVIAATLVALVTVLPTFGSPQKIDQLVYKNAALPRMVDDSTFLRRAYLKIVGRVPSYTEVEQFHKNPNRKQLIETLLNSEGFTNHLFNFWADKLRLKDKLSDNNGDLRGDAYIQWVRDSISKNKPYNKFVYELLSASGNYWENPATGYYLRDIGMQLDNTANTGKLFLGSDLSCAQCHDDPFDDWTQMDFYQLAAFTNSINMRQNDPKKENEIAKEAKKASGGKNGVDNKVKQLFRAATFGVKDNNKPLKLPHDYQYDDAKPHDIVSPRVPFGKNMVFSGSEREVFAKWVTTKNEMFAKNAVNRFWGWVFGAPLSAPSSDLISSPNQNKELIEHLSRELVRQNYDIKKFLSILYQSRAFSAEAFSGNIKDYKFDRPLVQRLSAEQIWDSVVTLYSENPDAPPNLKLNDIQDSMSYTLGELTGEEALKKAELFEKAKKEKFKEIPKERGFLMIRSAYINSPSKNFNLLKEFGRSDRVLISSPDLRSSVTQVLSTMNGDLSEIPLSKNSYLKKQLESTRAHGKRTDIVFMSILSRKPLSGKEKSLAYKDMKNNGGKGVVWALLNSKEFLYIK